MGAAGCSFAIRRAGHGTVRGSAAALGSNSPVGSRARLRRPRLFPFFPPGARARPRAPIGYRHQMRVCGSRSSCILTSVWEARRSWGWDSFLTWARAQQHRARARDTRREREQPPHRPHAARHWLRAGGCGGVRRGGGGAADCEDPRGDGGVARAPLCPRARGALARARRSAGRRALGCGRHTRGRAGGRRRQGGRRRVRAAASRWGRG